MFNPIPIDAPRFFSDKAHYIEDKETKSKRGADKTIVRYYVFSIGRSVKEYHLRDRYCDDAALEMLESLRLRKKRLVIKGYNSPSMYGSSMFVVLTHIGVYHRLKQGYAVFNPQTGEEGYYKLLVNEQ